MSPIALKEQRQLAHLHDVLGSHLLQRLRGGTEGGEGGDAPGTESPPPPTRQRAPGVPLASGFQGQPEQEALYQACVRLVRLQRRLILELGDAALQVREALAYWSTISPVYHAASVLPAHLWASRGWSWPPLSWTTLRHQWNPVLALARQRAAIRARVMRLRGAEATILRFLGALYALDMGTREREEWRSLSASDLSAAIPAAEHPLDAASAPDGEALAWITRNRDAFVEVLHAGLRELSQPPEPLFTLAPALDGAVWAGRSEENLVRAVRQVFPGPGLGAEAGSPSRPLLTLHLGSGAKPSGLVRLWIPWTVGSSAAWLLGRTVFRLQAPLLQLVRDVRTTTYHFLRDWVYQPLLDMYRVIRHDESSMRMVNAASLQSDVESLARMVASLARDQGRTVAEITALRDRCLEGDMRFVLEHYESEMTAPLRNVILGDFIRTILIQVQKAKVDTGLALSSLDKLMKSNELNFAFLAAMPTLAVCGALGWWVRSLLSRTPAWRLRSLAQIRGNLRTIDRALNKQPSDKRKGRILVELRALEDFLRPFPASRKRDLLQDLEDLYSVCEGQLSNAEGIHVMDRIWRTSLLALTGA